MSRLTHLSLFSGIGGLDLAAEWAGFETVGQCEWADYPAKVLEKHWPDVPRWKDIRTLNKESFYEKTGLRTVNIISGGFPCQPFSTAGKRRGTADDRYLWPEMLRVISEIRPSWVIGENVAGLVSMAKSSAPAGVEGRIINRLPDEDYYEAVWAQQETMLLVAILRDLENLGYEVQPFIIPACGVGALHRRNRLAIVGYTKHNGCAANTQLRGNDATGNGGWAKKQDTPIESAGAGRPAHESSLQGIQSESERIVANSNPQRLQGSQLNGAPDETRRGAKPHGAVSECSKVQRPDQWAIEPDVGRVANGIPNRVDRLKCLGNAVVPQQFYPIFKAIADIEMEVRR